MGWYGYGFRPYVPVAQRRANAARQMAKLAKKGQTINPVKIDGRQIARTFWGQAWCDNLESYSDFANRLPRGRTYVRNGSVVDLQVHPGKVTARVSGSELYTITIKIKPLNKNHWQAISTKCAGQIASVVELLQGRLSQGVMEIITHRDAGLFPKPAEISLDCSCPDWADMCKHVAAALYGVGARLDEKPELLFTLRQVDHFELIEQAASGKALAPAAASGKKTIAEGDLAEVFGIELDATAPPAATTAVPVAARAIAPVSASSPKKSKPRDTGSRRNRTDAKPSATAPGKKTTVNRTKVKTKRGVQSPPPSSRHPRR